MDIRTAAKQSEQHTKPWEKLLVNGVEIGEVREIEFITGEWGHQVVLTKPANVHIGGCGDTVEDAILQAIASGRQNAATLVARLDELDAIIAAAPVAEGVQG